MACNLISNIGVNMHRISLFCLNTLQPRQNGRHFADDIFKRIFVSDNVWIPIKISLKFVPKGPINNIPALVHIMTWRRPGDKPLYEPMMISLPTHICVTRPQCVKQSGLVPSSLQHIFTQFLVSLSHYKLYALVCNFPQNWESILHSIVGGLDIKSSVITIADKRRMGHLNKRI